MGEDQERKMQKCYTANDAGYTVHREDRQRFLLFLVVSILVFFSLSAHVMVQTKRGKKGEGKNSAVYHVDIELQWNGC